LALTVAFTRTPSASTFQKSDEGLVDFSVVGGIRFTVPGEWHVIASKSGPARTIMAFRIPNHADKHTHDSSNIAIISYNLKISEEQQAYEANVARLESDAKDHEVLDGWQCKSSTGMQASTEYMNVGCHRLIGDDGVTVQLAWPHLKKNPPDYDQQMELVLTQFLEAVVVSPYTSPVKK
jgi:hypothetical protein